MTYFDIPLGQPGAGRYHAGRARLQGAVCVNKKCLAKFTRRNRRSRYCPKCQKMRNSSRMKTWREAHRPKKRIYTPYIALCSAPGCRNPYERKTVRRDLCPQCWYERRLANERARLRKYNSKNT